MHVNIFYKIKINYLSGGESINLCEYGYKGALCSSCIQGYSKQGSNSCVECSSAAINLLSLCGILIIFLLFLLLMIWFIKNKILFFSLIGFLSNNQKN